MHLKLCLLFCLILFLITLTDQIGSENKKLQQKSFKEIFGEKWEEKRNEEQKKREIIGKFNKIKEKIKQKGRKYERKEWSQIEGKIAKKLGTNRQYILKWIKELGLNQKNCYKSKTDEEKFEIVQKFIKMTNEFKQKGRTYSKKEWNKNYEEISKKIGVSHSVIKIWKKQFGMTKFIMEKEKIEKMKIYWQIKREKPKMSDKEIAKMMKISVKSIFNWKKQFGDGLTED